MKKLLSFFALSLFAVAMFADPEVFWEESFNKNGNAVDKVQLESSTAWPYASQWFTGYTGTKGEVEGNQYIQDYSDVKSMGVSIRSKKLNGAESEVPGLYFAAEKEAEKCYVEFKADEIFDATNTKMDYYLNFTVCSTETDGGDLSLLKIYMNGLGLIIPETTLGNKFATSDVKVELPNMKIKSLHFTFAELPKNNQKFISKIWISGEENGNVDPEPEPLADGYYLVGSHNEWTPEASEMFSINENAGQDVEEYMLTTTIQEGNQVKVAQVSKEKIVKWFPEADESGDNNFEIGGALGGQILTIYFRPAGNPEWTDFGGFCYVEVAQNPGPGDDPINGFYLVGSFNDWNASPDYRITEREETTGLYYYEINLSEGWEFKVKEISDGMETWYPASDAENSNNCVVDAAHVGDARIYFDPEVPHAEWLFGHIDIQMLEAPAQDVTPDGLYLVGDFSDWKPKAEYMFIVNPKNPKEYMLNITLVEGQELKAMVVKSGAYMWFPDGEGNNIVVDAEHAGKVTIYFRPEGNKEWPLYYIFIEKDGAPAPKYLTCADLMSLAALLDEPTGVNPYVYGPFVILRAFVIEAGAALEPENIIRRAAANKQQEAWLADDKKAAKGTVKVVMATVEGAGVAKGDEVEIQGYLNKHFADGIVVLEVAKGTMKKVAAPQAIENTAVQIEVMKTIENGQLMIIRNGVKYNITGAVVE